MIAAPHLSIPAATGRRIEWPVPIRLSRCRYNSNALWGQNRPMLPCGGEKGFGLRPW